MTQGDKISAYMSIEDHIIAQIDNLHPYVVPIVRDKAHIAFIKTMPCCRCGKDDGKTSIYHLRSNRFCSKSKKAGDNQIIPLCRKCKKTGSDSVFKAYDEYEWFSSFLFRYPPHFAQHLYSLSGQDDAARAYLTESIKLYQLKQNA